jgi:hypothetical protein
VQVDAMASGADLHHTKESAAKMLRDYGRVKPNKPSRSSRLAWPALLRMLDKQDDSYRS